MIASAAAIDCWLGQRLVCPVTRESLQHDAVRGELVAGGAGLAYPIRDGVPVLLAEAARRLIPESS